MLNQKLKHFDIQGKVLDSLRKVVLDKNFGAIFNRNGIMVFKRGADKRANHAICMSCLNRREAYLLFHCTGENEAEKNSRKLTRATLPERDKEGELVYGP